MTKKINEVNLGITVEEGYELTKTYVEYFWRVNKFYSLKNTHEIDDVVSELIIKFLSKGFFEKYNPEVTSKKYYVMVGVKTSMIDLLRKHRDVYSIDKEDENGLTMMDRLASEENLEEIISGDDFCREIIESLPNETRSKVVGHSPFQGEVKMTHRVIAEHLLAGYSIKEIASMFINPSNNKPVTSGSISKIVKEIREMVADGMAYLRVRDCY